MIYLLHSDAEQAANFLAQVDVKGTLQRLLLALQQAHEHKSPRGRFTKWLSQDGFNYYWGAYFAERLQARSDCHNWTEIQSLRRHLPLGLRCREQMEFPLYVKRTFHSQSVVSAYRVAYFKRRQDHPQWKDSLGWSTCLADTLLTLEGSAREVLLRKLFNRPSSATNSRSGKVKRAPLRDGELYSPDGTPMGFRLWEGATKFHWNNERERFEDSSGKTLRDTHNF
jgi:hypothetical protein